MVVLASLNSITLKVGNPGVLTVYSLNDIVSGIEWVSYGNVLKIGKIALFYSAAENNAGIYTASFTYRVPGVYGKILFVTVEVLPPYDVSVIVTGTVTIVTNDLYDMVIMAGNETRFTIRAVGPSTTYQWYKNDVAISGATAHEYIISSTQSGDSAGYYVKVNGEQYTSATSHLTIINKLPISATVLKNGNNTFSIEVSSIFNTTYQWFNQAGPISGQTNSTYLIQNAQPINTYYYVKVNDRYTSPNVVLTVITALPSSATINSGVQYSLSVEATGVNTYTWTKDGNVMASTNNIYNIPYVDSVNGGTYYVKVNDYTSQPIRLTVVTQYPINTTIEVNTSYTFSITASGPTTTYQWLRDNNIILNATSNTYTITNVTPADNVPYYVKVNGGQYNSTPIIPIIVTKSPSTIISTIGELATFSIAVKGSRVQYQWYKNGNIISGATSNKYTIDKILESDVASYYVTVNGLAEYKSPTVQLVVINSTQPDIVCKVDQPTTFTINITGSSITYQWYKDGKIITGATLNTHTILHVQPADSGQYYVQVNNQYTSPPTILIVITEIYSATIDVGKSYIFSTVVNGIIPKYRWYKGSNLITSATSNTHIISKSQATDSATYYLTINDTFYKYDSFNLSIVTQIPVAGTIPVNTNYTFSIAVSGSNVTYQWYKGVIPITGATSNTYSIIRATLVDNADYYVTVNSIQYESKRVQLLVIGPPVINTQPLSQFFDINKIATLHVDVSGIGVKYQWYKDDHIIYRATSSTYTIKSMSLTDVGAYTVKVSTIGGEITSDKAIINIRTMPTITLQPISDQIIPINNNIDFSVLATGGDLTYKWQKYCMDISGSPNSNQYTIINSDISDQGIYRVCVFNSVGTVISNSSEVTIVLPPVIVNQTQSHTVVSEQPFNLIVNATGYGPLHYQWYLVFDLGFLGILHMDLSQNATSSTLHVDTIYSGGIYTYNVRVRNIAGTVHGENIIMYGVSKPEIHSQPISQSFYRGEKNVRMSVDADVFGGDAVGAVVTYQWYKNGNLIPNAINKTYIIPLLQVSDNGVYTIRISTIAGSIISTGATLTVYTEPHITKQPDSYYRVGENGSITLCGNVNGGNITAQWRKGGVDIPGATNICFTINNIRIDQAGQYTVYCTNELDSIETEPYNVYVEPIECFPLQGSAGGLAGGGNSSSGLTDLLIERTQRCAIQQVLPTERVNICCPSVQVPLYNGGTSSAALLNTQMKAQAICTQASNKALALQRVSVPACPVSIVDSRFDKYQRRGPPIPCTPPPTGLIIPNNPAVPKAVDGYCVNVIGISQSRF